MLRGLDPHMSLSRVAAIIEIAKHTPGGGIPITDLAEVLDISVAAASGNVSVMSEFQSRKKMGMGLVQTTVDPYNRRMHLVSLTEKGQEFYNKLLEVS